MVSVSVPPSSSVTVALTAAVPAPESSNQVHLKLPVLEAGVKTTSEAVPFTPQLTELPGSQERVRGAGISPAVGVAVGVALVGRRGTRQRDRRVDVV